MEKDIQGQKYKTTVKDMRYLPKLLILPLRQVVDCVLSVIFVEIIQIINK